MTVKQTIAGVLAAMYLPLAVLTVSASGALFASVPARALDKGCEVETSILDCNAAGNSVDNSGNLKNTGLWSIVLIAIGILTAGIGVAALAGIVYGIVLYTISRGDPGGIKKALEVIRNVVIGVAAYALMWSALNWLIPGGVFN